MARGRPHARRPRRAPCCRGSWTRTRTSRSRAGGSRNSTSASQGATYSQIAARGGGSSRPSRRRARRRGRPGALTRARLDAMLLLGNDAGRGQERLRTVDRGRDQAAPRRSGWAPLGHPVEVVPTFLGAHTIPKERRERPRALRRRDRRARCFRRSPGASSRSTPTPSWTRTRSRAAEARRVLEAAQPPGWACAFTPTSSPTTARRSLAAELRAASADHLEHVSDAGIEALAKAGTAAVLLPAATFFLMSRSHSRRRAV